MMEHTRKMAVIPISMLDRLHQQQQLTDAPLAHMSDLDQQMTSIMNDRQLPPDIKLKQYNQVLNRYMTIRENEIRKPVSVQVVGPEQPSSTKYPEPYDIIGTMPQNYRNKARTLLESIKRNPDISWNDKDELLYKGNVIPG